MYSSTISHKSSFPSSKKLTSGVRWFTWFSVTSHEVRESDFSIRRGGREGGRGEGRMWILDIGGGVREVMGGKKRRRWRGRRRRERIMGW